MLQAAHTPALQHSACLRCSSCPLPCTVRRRRTCRYSHRRGSSTASTINTTCEAGKGSDKCKCHSIYMVIGGRLNQLGVPAMFYKCYMWGRGPWCKSCGLWLGPTMGCRTPRGPGSPTRGLIRQVNPSMLPVACAAWRPNLCPKVSSAESRTTRQAAPKRNPSWQSPRAPAANARS